MHKNMFGKTIRGLLLILALVALAACSRDNIKDNTAEPTVSPTQYDLVVRADKDGQFDLEGATIDGQTLRDHIRYRNEAGQPVRSVLLKRGEKEKITHAQVAALAGIARDLKLEAYVLDNDNRLKVIQIKDDPK